MIKKFVNSILLLLVTAGLTSCLQDNEDYFSLPAAQRIEEVVAADKALLESATNGWHLEYFLGDDYQYGGFNMLVRFVDGKAQLSSEIAPSEMVSTSCYNVNTDMGPVLTFNTYNEILHSLSQPRQNPVDGQQGDFEFVIMKATTDSIYLRGKKWGNDMLMTRLPETTSWKLFLDSIATVKENMLYTYELNLDTNTVSIELDDNKQFYSVLGEEEQVMPFIFTTKGIKLRQPINIGNAKLQFLDFNTEQMALVSSENPSLMLESVLPDDWQPFDAFEGNYILAYEDGSSTANVQLVADKPNKRYLMKGLSNRYDVVLNYIPGKGALGWNSQELGVDASGITVMMCAWETKEGYLTWSTDAGVYLVWNQDRVQPAYTFVDNDYGFDTDSFILWGMVGGQSNGSYTAWSPSRLRHIVSLTKIVN